MSTLESKTKSSPYRSGSNPPHLLPISTTKKPITNNRFSEDAQDLDQIKTYLLNNDFQQAIITAFNLPPGGTKDDYVYHAIASVTLEQVQCVIEAGEKNGLHRWYVDEEGKSVCLFISYSDTVSRLASKLKKEQGELYP